jgi:hypothetical protein
MIRDTIDFPLFPMYADAPPAPAPPIVQGYVVSEGPAEIVFLARTRVITEWSCTACGERFTKKGNHIGARRTCKCGAVGVVKGTS